MSDDLKRRAYFLVSYELLANMMQLPEGINVTFVTAETSVPRCFQVHVEGEGLPLTLPQGPVPQICPTMTLAEAPAVWYEVPSLLRLIPR